MAREYVHGSAARKLDRQPRQPRYYTVEPIRQPKQKTVQLSVPYVMMLCVAATICMIVAFNTIKLNSEVSNLRNRKGGLTDQYEKLVLSNDLYYDSILSNVDLAEVERIAVSELGMRMAQSGQVVSYSGDIEDYVKQYNDLPTP